MPDIFAGLDTPKWQSPDQSALAWEHASTWIAPVLLQGRKLAMEQQQQNAMLPLEVQKQDLQNKSTQARIIGEGFANQKAELDLKNGLEDQATMLETIQKYPDISSQVDAVPVRPFKTPQNRLAFEAWRKDAAMTMVGQAKLQHQTSLFKAAATLLNGGGGDAIYADNDGNLQVNEEMLSAGLATMRQKKEEEALKLKTAAPLINLQGREYTADTRYWTAVDVATIKTQEDFQKAAQAWQHKALDSLGKADFEVYHEKLIGIRQDKSLDATTAARKMDLLNQQFKLNAQSSSAVTPAAAPSGRVDTSKELNDAASAIRSGAPADTVKARYKQRTGQDYPE